MGEVFAGRFELLEPIAEGGMGVVWQVRDLRDGEIYAGKVLRHSDSHSLLRFLREQATRIEHAHVVTPLSWAGEDDRVLFTMPLVRGGSVATLIGDHGALPARWVVAILEQALHGLAAVHDAGLVHRDVKPGNLLLEATGEGRPHVRVGDFGLAVRRDDPRLTRASQVLGSPGYLSPEQLAGADPDPRQDLYAVGMCGLEMATGLRPPACVPTARDLARRSPGHAPLLDVLLTAISTDPDRRPPDAEAMAAALLTVPLPADPEGEPPIVFDQFGSVATSAEASPTTVAHSQGAADPRRAADLRRAALFAVVALLCLAGAVLVWP